MGRKIALREDFDGPGLRRLAKASKDAGQNRRLLALAEIYDGAKRTQAMQWHLDEISSQVAPGAHAVLIIWSSPIELVHR